MFLPLVINHYLILAGFIFKVFSVFLLFRAINRVNNRSESRLTSDRSFDWRPPALIWIENVKSGWRLCRHLALNLIIFDLFGRETDWLYSSSEGRRELAANAKFQRLIVVHLGRDHQFPSLEHIQDELRSVVTSLQPNDLPANTQVRAAPTRLSRAHFWNKWPN